MKQILWFIKTYFTFVILFGFQKPFFMILEKASATQPIDNIWSEMPTVMWYGLSLDLSMAGYLTALPGLLLIAMIWFRKEIIRPILNAYYILASFLVSITFVLNAGLYPYWNFPLDSTPLYYFFTSPKDALASVGGLYIFLALLITVLLTIAVWFSLRMPLTQKRYSSRYSNYGFGDSIWKSQEGTATYAHTIDDGALEVNTTGVEVNTAWMLMPQTLDTNAKINVVYDIYEKDVLLDTVTSS